LQCTAASAASMARASIISIAAGSTPALMIDEVAAPASSVEGNPASSVRTSWGSRTSRTVAAVAMPSVPSEPTTAPSRS
jgi:hypothetical protein